MSESDVNIYDEACREIRLALDAYAVSVVDLSQFHLFYPAYQSSSMGNSSTQRGSSVRSANTAIHSGSRSFASSNAQTESYRRGGSSATGAGQGTTGSSGGSGIGGFGRSTGQELSDEDEAYGKSDNPKIARATYAVTDATAPSRMPQVLFVPNRRRTDPKRSRYTTETEDPRQDDVGNLSFLEQVVRGSNLVSVLSCADLLKQLAVLGYSCEFDGFVFNFSSSPTARRIISDFIASNVKVDP